MIRQKERDKEIKTNFLVIIIKNNNNSALMSTSLLSTLLITKLSYLIMHYN